MSRAFAKIIKILPPCLLIIAGMYITAYPWIKSTGYEYKKRMLLSAWEKETAGGYIPPAVSKQVEHVQNDVFNEYTENESPTFDVSYVLENMEGIIRIDKIKLLSPILRGADKSKLDIAVCSVAGSPEMGGYGNYCVAGHKSRIYGRHFNRIAELAAGDEVILSNGAEDFYFTVTETFLVTPEDTWVLADTEGKTELTLITCDYSTKPTGRLIIRCSTTN